MMKTYTKITFINIFYVIYVILSYPDLQLNLIVVDEAVPYV